MSLIGPSPYTTYSRNLIIFVEMKYLNKKMIDMIIVILLSTYYVSGTVLGDL